MIQRYIIIILLGSAIGSIYAVIGGLILLVLGAIINVDIMNNDTAFYLLLLVSYLMGGADVDKDYLIERLKDM